jgi:hypothetical protein
MPSGAGAPNSIVNTYPSRPGVPGFRSARVARYGERWARTKASLRRALAAGAAISAVRSARPGLSPGPRPPNPSTRTGSLAASAARADGGRLDHHGRAQRIARARPEDQQVPGRDAALGERGAHGRVTRQDGAAADLAGYPGRGLVAGRGGGGDVICSAVASGSSVGSVRGIPVLAVIAASIPLARSW